MRCRSISSTRHSQALSLPGGVLVTRWRRPTVCFMSGPMNPCLGSEQGCIARHSIEQVRQPANSNLPRGPDLHRLYRNPQTSIPGSSSHRLRLAMKLSAAHQPPGDVSRLQQRAAECLACSVQPTYITWTFRIRFSTALEKAIGQGSHSKNAVARAENVLTSVERSR